MVRHEKIREKFSELGLKVTHPRVVIYTELLSSKEHPSPEQIYSRIKKDNPSISLATVYKTLDTFVENGLAKKVKSSNGIMRYDSIMDSHNHLYCNESNRILDYKDEELNELLNDYFKKKKIDGFEINEIQVQINGRIIKNKKKGG